MSAKEVVTKRVGSKAERKKVLRSIIFLKEYLGYLFFSICTKIANPILAKENATRISIFLTKINPENSSSATAFSKV